jgi:hypothetical protein
MCESVKSNWKQLSLHIKYILELKGSIEELVVVSDKIHGVPFLKTVILKPQERFNWTVTLSWYKIDSCKIFGSHNSVPKDTGLLGCDMSVMPSNCQ